MYLTGIADEAGANIDTQIKATQTLGWTSIEGRMVEVPGFDKANFHDVPDAAFDLVADKLQAAGIGICCFGSAIMNWAKTVDTPFSVTQDEVQHDLRHAQTVRACGARECATQRVRCAAGGAARPCVAKQLSRRERLVSQNEQTGPSRKLRELLQVALLERVDGRAQRFHPGGHGAGQRRSEAHHGEAVVPDLPGASQRFQMLEELLVAQKLAR